MTFRFHSPVESAFDDSERCTLNSAALALLVLSFVHLRRVAIRNLRSAGVAIPSHMMGSDHNPASHSLRPILRVLKRTPETGGEDPILCSLVEGYARFKEMRTHRSHTPRVSWEVSDSENLKCPWVRRMRAV